MSVLLLLKNFRNNTELGAQLSWAYAAPGDIDSLAEDEIHIWALPLTLTKEQSKQAILWLNDHQRDRYERRASEALKQSYLAARFYLLTLLSAYCGLPTAQISLTYSRLNKPSLKPNPQGVTFNFTDSHGGATSTGIFAFSRAPTIGVDIESRLRRSNFDAVARRKFSRREQALVSTHAGAVDAERFLALWTRKEAYGKATGQGVNYRMSELDLASPETHSLSFTGLDQGNRYQLNQFLVGDEHIACVVYAAGRPLKLRPFSPAT